MISRVSGIYKYLVAFSCGLLMLIIPAVSSALMLGPYTGTVIDSRSGGPVHGASVLIYWEKPAFSAIEYRTDTVGAKLVYTAQDGSYEVPKMFVNTGLSSALDSTHVIIYQPGYEAYIVTIRHTSSSKPEKAFKKTGNVIKLDRVPPVFSHGSHYQKIESALWGLNDMDYPFSIPENRGDMWDKFIKANVKWVPEREEFLRRAQWEERRGESEDKE